MSTIPYHTSVLVTKGSVASYIPFQQIDYLDAQERSLKIDTEQHLIDYTQMQWASALVVATLFATLIGWGGCQIQSFNLQSVIGASAVAVGFSCSLVFVCWVCRHVKEYALDYTMPLLSLRSHIAQTEDEFVFLFAVIEDALEQNDTPKLREGIQQLLSKSQWSRSDDSEQIDLRDKEIFTFLADHCLEELIEMEEFPLIFAMFETIGIKKEYADILARSGERITKAFYTYHQIGYAANNVSDLNPQQKSILETLFLRLAVPECQQGYVRSHQLPRSFFDFKLATCRDFFEIEELLTYAIENDGVRFVENITRSSITATSSGRELWIFVVANFLVSQRKNKGTSTFNPIWMGVHAQPILRMFYLAGPNHAAWILNFCQELDKTLAAHMIRLLLQEHFYHRMPISGSIQVFVEWVKKSDLKETYDKTYQGYLTSLLQIVQKFANRILFMPGRILTDVEWPLDYVFYLQKGIESKNWEVIVECLMHLFKTQERLRWVKWLNDWKTRHIEQVIFTVLNMYKTNLLRQSDCIQFVRAFTHQPHLISKLLRCSYDPRGVDTFVLLEVFFKHDKDVFIDSIINHSPSSVSIGFIEKVFAHYRVPASGLVLASIPPLPENIYSVLNAINKALGKKDSQYFDGKPVMASLDAVKAVLSHD